MAMTVSNEQIPVQFWRHVLSLRTRGRTYGGWGALNGCLWAQDRRKLAPNLLSCDRAYSD
jgi:hypothetical protein